MANTVEKNKISAKKKGVVVSDRMTKTLIVFVTELKTHQKYKKKFKSTKRYKVHDEDNKYKTGDMVEIVSCRPISKEKFYKVI